MQNKCTKFNIHARIFYIFYTPTLTTHLIILIICILFNHWLFCFCFFEINMKVNVHQVICLLQELMIPNKYPMFLYDEVKPCSNMLVDFCVPHKCNLKQGIVNNSLQMSVKSQTIYYRKCSTLLTKYSTTVCYIGGQKWDSVDVNKTNL